MLFVCCVPEWRRTHWQTPQYHNQQRATGFIVFGSHLQKQTANIKLTQNAHCCTIRGAGRSIFTSQYNIHLLFIFIHKCNHNIPVSLHIAFPLWHGHRISIGPLLSLRLLVLRVIRVFGRNQNNAGMPMDAIVVCACACAPMEPCVAFRIVVWVCAEHAHRLSQAQLNHNHYSII